jgi:hypothetical protein
MNFGSTALIASPGEPQAWVEAPRASEYVSCTAELAECTCPEYCERDHDTD